MKITLLHYRYVPAFAGVELVMEQHARLFADDGHEVTVLTGSPESVPARDRRVKVVVIPELTKEHPLRIAADNEAADSPSIAPHFDALVLTTRNALRPFLQEAGAVFIHNVLTMPFHLACTVALWQLADELPAGRLVSWVHDLAAVNPDYAIPSNVPWTLLRRRHPAIRVVAISDLRARQFEALTGTAPDAVIPNGIEPLDFLSLTPRVAQFVAEHRLLDADLLLFQPARIVRRKNIELGIRLVAELKSRACRAKLLITGAPDGHNVSSELYRSELQDLRRRLDVEDDIRFINEFFPVTKNDLASFHRVADVLWFPSRQEGFGLPVLEAAVSRLLIFCADVEPMNTFPLSTAEFFDPAAEPNQIADQLLRFLKKNSSFPDTRRNVILRFAWQAIWPQIQKLLTPFEPQRMQNAQRDGAQLK